MGDWEMAVPAADLGHEEYQLRQIQIEYDVI
jgi:hypothetical protein